MMLFNKKTKSPFAIDGYGTRAERVNKIYKPDNIYASKMISSLAVLAFIVIDFYCLKVIWNMVQIESPMYVFFVSLGCAAALDLPLAVAAVALKKAHHNVMSRKEAMIITVLSITTFLIAFVFSLMFRIVTRELSFDVGSTSTLVGTIGEITTQSGDNSGIVLFSALFNGVLPLLTSLASFIVSYFATDPITDKLKTLKTEKIKLQSNIIEADAAIAESESAEEHCKALLAREKDLLTKFLNQVDGENMQLKQLARQVLMEKLGKPDEILSLTESSEKLSGIKKVEDDYESELVKHMMDEIVKKKKDVIA